MNVTDNCATFLQIMNSNSQSSTPCSDIPSQGLVDIPLIKTMENSGP